MTNGFVAPAGEVLRFTDSVGFLLSPQAGSNSDLLTIRGIVEVTLPTTEPSVLGVTVDFFSNPPLGAVLTIESTGILTVVSRRPESFYNAGGIRVHGRDVDVVNNGIVRVEANGSATGLFNSVSDDWFFRNSGSLTANSSGSEAIGVIMVGAVQNSGLISVSGKTVAIGVDVTRFAGASLYNSGTIRVEAPDLAVEGIGVLWRSLSLTSQAFTNEGRIEADVALRVFSNPLPARPAETFANSGVIVGRMEFGDGAARLVNSGQIEGAVRFGGAADIYDGRGGRASGMVSGGDGTDSLAGGAGFDNFQGNAGNDTEAGGDGDDWVVGGRDNDVLFGDAGNDLVYGNLGSDTCDGGEGADILRGGQEDDVVGGGAGNDFVSGDKGADTMSGGAGADIFHTFGEAGVDRVTDFSLAEGDRVQLDPGTQYTLAQVGADTVINMTGGGQMILVGVQMASLTPGWIFGA